MKSSELMIGDLVTFKDCQNEEEIVVIKIWQLNQEGNAFVFIDDSKVLDEIAIDDEIVGIHLTPEILEKNGFVRHGNEYCNLQQWILKIGDKKYLSIEQDTQEEEFCVETIWINYVHEMQHILKLCKIEKEIEL